MAGIYIHIPFCKTRCIYCDFYSTTRSELKQQYIRALCTELKTRKGYLKEEPIETIYFGGGTPSQLAHEDFEQIFRTIKEVYGTEHAEEITLEANPDLTRHIGAGNKDRTATKRNVIGDTMLYKRMIKALCMKRFTLVTSFRKSIIGQPIPKLGNRAKRIHQSKIAENLFNLFLPALQ